MPTDKEYVARIQACDHSALWAMRSQIAAGENVEGWDAGRALEYLILRQFEIEGAEVRWPFPVQLQRELAEQIDGAVYCDGLACLIETKDQQQAVNVEPIAKLRNQLSRRPSGTLNTFREVLTHN